MAQSGTRVVYAGIPNDVQSFVSAEVDFLTLSWIYAYSGEAISANAGVPIVNWYIPVGLTGFSSGTAVGGSAMWVKVSATAPPNAESARVVSARALSTSAKNLFEVFYVRVHTGLL